MEGVNMPASFKFAWRQLVGATAAAIFVLAALPGVGHAENIEICIGAKGKVKGINLGTERMQRWSDRNRLGHHWTDRIYRHGGSGGKPGNSG